MDGVLVLLKPPGLTSHDAVALVRQASGEKRVGHAGTLDPGAAGVLVLLLGQAVRLSEYLMSSRKRYRAELTLGVSTDTQDAFGKVLRETEVPALAVEEIEAVLAGFVGEIWQTPPSYSALKKGGRRLYELARAGETVVVEPRLVTIYRLTLLEKVEGGPHPRFLLDVECSRGTYVRTLCADIGEKLGVGGHLSFLLRVASGPLGLERALTLEEILALSHSAELQERLLSLAEALPDWPQITVSEKEKEAVGHGRPLWRRAPRGVGWETQDPGGPSRVGEGLVKVCTEDGQLLALAVTEEKAGGYLYRMKKVFRER